MTAMAVNERMRGNIIVDTQGSGIWMSTLMKIALAAWCEDEQGVLVWTRVRRPAGEAFWCIRALIRRAKWKFRL